MFRPVRVMDDGMVALDLVRPVTLTNGLSHDLPEIAAAVRAAAEAFEALGVSTPGLSPARVYGRAADGQLELRRFLVPVPGTQELRREQREQPRKRKPPFRGRRGRRK